MEKMIINGREITTNYNNDTYPLCNGEDKKTMTMHLSRWILNEGERWKHKESDREFFERLVSYGYTRITFYEVTTAVKGYHDTIAYCK